MCARVTPTGSGPPARAPSNTRRRRWQQAVLLSVAVGSLAAGVVAPSEDTAVGGKFYQVVDGKVDARTYNGYRRYHAGCNHCHGPAGLGSTVAPSLVDRLPDVEAFRRIVREGVSGKTGVMQGFAADPNVVPYIDDLYAYLQARADGALGRGRPRRLDD